MLRAAAAGRMSIAFIIRIPSHFIERITTAAIITIKKLSKRTVWIPLEWAIGAEIIIEFSLLRKKHQNTMTITRSTASDIISELLMLRISPTMR